MKTLIIETPHPRLLGELVSASGVFCETPDLVVLGPGDVQGTYGKAYRVADTLGANIVPALAQLVSKEGYEVVVLSATAVGTGIAGPLAARLGFPILSEVTGASSDLVIETSLYGSKAVARYEVESGPLVLTIKRSHFTPAALDGTSKPIELPSGPQRMSLLAEVEDERAGIPLEDAEVIVTGGRGIGAAENFSLLSDLATLLNGAVGASRGAVDEGWMPPGAQIGQTGTSVAPNVYFAVGVSGASQHLAGIANAKCVVAINKDSEANIFKRARFGLVGDYRRTVPALIASVKGNP